MSSSQQACPTTGTCQAGQRAICLPPRPMVLDSQSASASATRVTVGVHGCCIARNVMLLNARLEMQCLAFVIKNTVSAQLATLA